MSPKISLSPNSGSDNSYRDANNVSGDAWKIQKRLNVSVEGKILATQASIEVTNAEVVLKASKTYVDGADANLQSQITVSAGNILLKVSKNEIISQINLSTEGITISAAKIDLSGYVTITNIGNGTTSIDGSNIKTGYISANRIAADTITANHLNITTLAAITVNAGTITAGNIAGWKVDGSVFTGASGAGGGVTYLNQNGHLGFFGDANSGHVLATYGGAAVTDTGIRFTTAQGRGAVFGSGEPYSSTMGTNGGKPEAYYVDLINTASGGVVRIIGGEIQIRPLTLEGVRTYRDANNSGYGQNMQLKFYANLGGNPWYARYMNGILVSCTQTADTSGLYEDIGF